MVQIQEHHDDDDQDQHPHHPYPHHHQLQLQQPSSSSSTFNNFNSSPSPLHSPHSPDPHHHQEDQQQHHSSPSSPSSISSDHTFHGFSPPKSPSPSPPSLVPTPVVSTSNRLVHDPPPDPLTKSDPDAHTGFATSNTQLPNSRKTTRPEQARSVLSRARKEKLLKSAGLSLRFLEVVICLVSFSVMAADKRRGWALDSFDRYIEFRYSMTMNVIGFAYAGLQGLDLLLLLTTGKDLVRGQLRSCFDFAMDQILAYLLLSSASSAFTRVDDWVSNWGKDRFPAMASASVGVSFLAFSAFALSSLISGYVLSTRRLT